MNNLLIASTYKTNSKDNCSGDLDTISICGYQKVHPVFFEQELMTKIETINPSVDNVFCIVLHSKIGKNIIDFFKKLKERIVCSKLKEVNLPVIEIGEQDSDSFTFEWNFNFFRIYFYFNDKIKTESHVGLITFDKINFSSYLLDIGDISKYEDAIVKICAFLEEKI